MRGSDGFRGRDRGVTAVIGFILIFGILVISFSLYQAKVVPQQNADVEFEQYQEVQEQMVDLRNTVVSMYDSTSSESTAVDLGVRYPSRTVFVNPGPASARLQTEGTGDPGVNVTIQNARAIASEGAGETASFWNGTEQVYETGSIEYRPDYNRFQGAQRIVYEHGLTYSQVDTGAGSVPLTRQSLIQDDRISLVALNGSLGEGGTGTRSVDFEPLSTRSRVVEVNNDTGPITLEFASRMDASVWNETLEDQLVGNGGHVESVGFSREGPDGFDVIAVTLEPDQRYELELAKVGVGTGTTATTEQYLTAVEGANAVVQSGSTQRLTVEARDRFNTPKSGVHVEADPSGGAFLNSTNVTGPDGQATFLYEAQTAGTHRVNFTIDPGYEPDSSHDPSTATNVSTRVVVPAISGSSGSGGGGLSVGSGGSEDYSNSRSDTFSAANGRWEGITCTDQLRLSDGYPASRPNGNNLQGDVIRLSASLENSTGERYTVDSKLSRKNDGSFNKKTVTVYDGTGNNQNAELLADAATAIYDGGETDMLDISNYTSGPSSDFAGMLADIRNLDAGAPVVWQTSRMTGRVDVALGCDASGGAPGAVSTVDGTTPDNGDSALRFDIQAPSGTTKTVVNLTTTTPGNSNSNVNNERLKRNSGEEIYLNVSDTTGNDQSGGHEQNSLKLDGTTYDLDKGNKGTNAIFSDGATLSVNMGELDSGNTQWTYDLVGSESSADVVVTFGFEDGSQFQAYLQVTNVNS